MIAVLSFSIMTAACYKQPRFVNDSSVGGELAGRTPAVRGHLLHPDLHGLGRDVVRVHERVGDALDQVAPELDVARALQDGHDGHGGHSSGSSTRPRWPGTPPVHPP